MLRTLLISTALVAASGTALAHGEVTGRVITVEPRISVSFGTGYHDGFRVLYESGGARYWTHTPYHPGQVIVVPPRVHHVHHHHRHERWDDHRHWKDHHAGGRHGYRDRHDHRGDHRGDHRRPPGHRY